MNKLAAKAVKWIDLLYTLEANLRAEGASAEKTAAERTAKALPLMYAMEGWMKAVHLQCTPADPMGKALDYVYKLWPRLRRYALDGRYHIDNNAVERNQRLSYSGARTTFLAKNRKFYSLLRKGGLFRMVT